LSIELWQNELDEIKNVSITLNSPTAKSALRDAYHSLQKKIEDEQKRIDFDKTNKDVIPEAFKRVGIERKSLEWIDNVIYCIDKSGKLDKDGSYNWYHYVWIPQTKIKYAKLCIHTLGKDVYGDRYYLEVEYFKHPADNYSYLSKRIDPFNRTYLSYVHYVLDALGLNGVDYKYKTR
jgi:hypothetical protein